MFLAIVLIAGLPVVAATDEDLAVARVLVTIDNTESLSGWVPLQQTKDEGGPRIAECGAEWLRCQ